MYAIAIGNGDHIYYNLLRNSVKYLACLHISFDSNDYSQSVNQKISNLMYTRRHAL